MSSRAERLQAYIDLVKDTPCQWGRDDCSMFAGRWIERERSVDLALPVYGSEAEARERIERHGGLLNIWEEIARLSNIMETGDPELGDVGLIETMRFGPVGVIFAQGGIAIWRATQGLTFLRPREKTILKVWAI